MSQTSLIYCRLVPELDKYWHFLGPDGQLFYDSRLNMFTFRNGIDFWTVTMKDNIPVPDMKFQISNVENIQAIAFSKNKKYLTMQTSVSTLRIVNLENHQEHKIALKSWDKMITIIIFDWLWNCPGIDFFIVDAFSIRLYKLDEEKFQLKEIGSQSIDSHYAWFEPKSESLVVAQTSGAFQVINLESYQKTKKLKGPNFNIDLRTDIEAQSGMSPTAKSGSKSPKNAFFSHVSLRNRNILYTSLMDQNLEYHRQKIMLVNMYGVASLIHININFGKVFIYFITPDKVTPYQASFTVPCESIYSMSLVDNLLLVNNISENISFLYDVRKSNPIQTVGSPQSLVLYKDKSSEDSKDHHKESLAQDQEDLKDGNSITMNESQITSMSEATSDSINGKPEETIITNHLNNIKKDEEESKQQHFNGSPGQHSHQHKLKSLVPMEQNPLYLTSTKFLEYSFFVDVKNKQIIRYELDAKDIPKLLDDKIDALFFLIRRNGCKDRALDFLKEIILKKQELMTLSFVFNKFAEVYKKAHEEREAQKDLGPIETRRQASFGPSSTRYMQHSSMLSSNSLRPDPLGNLKTSSSYNVIVQSDLHARIFAPLAENPEFDQNYLIHILLEYFRVSMGNIGMIFLLIFKENGISVLDETQAIFFKLILMNKQFSLLQFLLQFHCLHDSVELAEVLLKLGIKDKSKFKGNKDNAFTKHIKDEYFSEMFQLGLDMMLRLEKLKEVIEHLLAAGRIIDAMELAKRKGFEGINPRWFLEAAVKEGSECPVGDVISFFLNNVRRGKSEEKCFFEQDVTEIIKSFQNDNNH